MIIVIAAAITGVCAILAALIPLFLKVRTVNRHVEEVNRAVNQREGPTLYSLVQTSLEGQNILREDVRNIRDRTLNMEYFLETQFSDFHKPRPKI